MNEEYKIKGWVARDKYFDPLFGNGLILHSQKPTRDRNEWSGESILIHLPNRLFPDLSFDDEPIEVELIIKKT